MLSLIHRLVAIPAVYDLSQRLAGVKTCWQMLGRSLRGLPPGARVLDIGAGTGLAKKLFPAACVYTACEPDPEKREGLLKVCPPEAIMQAPATAIPVADSSFDACLLCFVAHHLSDDELRAALLEIGRVLAPQGTLFLLDPLWEPSRLRSRVLWALDRGSHPRTLPRIREFVDRCFTVQEEIQWHVHHRYALLACQPRDT